MILFKKILPILIFFFGCKSEAPKLPVHLIEKPSTQSAIQEFDGQRAYEILKDQVSFGPRVPNTYAHQQCLNFLEMELKKYADEVKLQNFTDIAYENQTLKLTNIIASFRPKTEKRILLCAHWDSNPWASQDSALKNRNKPIPGANDGASGVAVLLEIARILKSTPPLIGVDIVLFDGEDFAHSSDINAFLRGSKYFAKHIETPFIPVYGILLDMIGDKQLEIPKEGYSMKYAPDIVEKVWSVAKDLNMSQFVDETQSEIIDDHLPLNQAGIKTIDLIDFNYPDATNKYWHTLQDTPDKCSPESLEAVGKVLLHLIYNEF
jgi:glutaminyl-peptide cyclotransferase